MSAKAQAAQGRRFAERLVGLCAPIAQQHKCCQQGDDGMSLREERSHAKKCAGKGKPPVGGAPHDHDRDHDGQHAEPMVGSVQEQ